jgi:hypothetical protein
MAVVPEVPAEVTPYQNPFKPLMALSFIWPASKSAIALGLEVGEGVGVLVGVVVGVLTGLLVGVTVGELVGVDGPTGELVGEFEGVLVGELVEVIEGVVVAVLEIVGVFAGGSKGLTGMEIFRVQLTTTIKEMNRVAAPKIFHCFPVFTSILPAV